MIKKISFLVILLNHVSSFAAFVNGDGDEIDLVKPKNAPVSLSFAERIAIQSTKLIPGKERPHCNDCGVCPVCKERAKQSPAAAFLYQVKNCHLKRPKVIHVDDEKLSESRQSASQRGLAEKKHTVDLTECERYLKRFQKNKKEAAPLQRAKVIFLDQRDIRFFADRKAVETSPYAPFLHQIKSVLFWVSQRESGVQLPNLNPKKNTRAFGRITGAEKLPFLDDWASVGENKDIIIFFQDHQTKMNSVFQAIRKKRTPLEETDNDEIQQDMASLRAGNGPRVWADPALFVHRLEIEKFLQKNPLEYKNIWAKDVISNGFLKTVSEINPQRAQEFLEQDYQTWWGGLSYLQRIGYVRWTKDDILKIRPWVRK